MPLYREDLNGAQTCAKSSGHRKHAHGETYLHARCHLDAPTWVSYLANVLTIHCSECKRVVASIVVASRKQPGSRP